MENLKKTGKMAQVEGIEPPTQWLTATCSTDWATPEYKKISYIKTKWFSRIFFTNLKKIYCLSFSCSSEALFSSEGGRNRAFLSKIGNPEAGESPFLSWWRLHKTRKRKKARRWIWKIKKIRYLLPFLGEEPPNNINPSNCFLISDYKFPTYPYIKQFIT